MAHSDRLNVKVIRTRRNALKMAGILATAGVTVLASSRKGRADPGNGNGWGDGDGGGRDHDAHCLLKGTTVRTASGDRKIEELAMGDLLPTMYGGMRPIQWIGRCFIQKGGPSKPWPRSLQPIHVVPSAIGPGIPHNDLFLSPEHALLLNGVLVTAGSLVNDVSIRRFDVHEYNELQYFHVKVEGHDVIYAEGVPVETMLKAGESFTNFDEYVRLYGEPLEGTPCAPFVSCTGARRELKSRARSALAPWIDRRQQVDLIRDRLEERALSQELELA